LVENKILGCPVSDADKEDKVIGLIDLIDITKYLLDYRQEHGTANFEQALKSIKVSDLISKGHWSLQTDN
jgi:hypothetical protein